MRMIVIDCLVLSVFYMLFICNVLHVKLKYTLFIIKSYFIIS